VLEAYRLVERDFPGLTGRWEVDPASAADDW
jgi:hypothetical protein